jgi:hypothetical protein
MEVEFYFYRNSKNIMYICRDCGGKKESEIFRGTQIYIKGCGVSGESKRAAVYSMYIVNPNSHGVFFVSRLTAVGRMRHPFKADLGEK